MDSLPGCRNRKGKDNCTHPIEFVRFDFDNTSKEDFKMADHIPHEFFIRLGKLKGKDNHNQSSLCLFNLDNFV